MHMCVCASEARGKKKKKLGKEKAKRWLLPQHIIQKLISAGYQSHFRDGE